MDVSGVELVALAGEDASAKVLQIHVLTINRRRTT